MGEGLPLSFPERLYTPFGYLHNPAARAVSWEEGWGGALRTTLHRVGFEWLYPWSRDPIAGCGITVTFGVDETTFITRADYSRARLHCKHHSALVFTYGWTYGGVEGEAHFFLTSPDALACVAMVRNSGSAARLVRLDLVASAWEKGRQVAPQDFGRLATFVFAGAPRHTLAWKELREPEPAEDRRGGAQGGLLLDGANGAIAHQVGPGARSSQRYLAPGTVWETWAVLSRSAEHAGSLLTGREIRERLEALLREDEDFYSACPILSGDWPDAWKNGWVYDIESTRMMVMPPGGVFRDVWPAWRLDQPRAVLAEGTLDMARLSLAAPDLAERAVTSLFRDAPSPNVPCIFQGGEPNMVAADGSACGTSPAWCMPFYNLKLVYLRTLDRAWLATIYPYLVAYLQWWLVNRVDKDGWCYYLCTWESGEDSSPRLDPGRTGDGIISGSVRPVELQASMAYSADVLSMFARELGLEDDGEKWRRVAGWFRDRTQLLWDPQTGRFRDLDHRTGGFLQPHGLEDYWGIDAVRFSPLSLLPLAYGMATPEQVAALASEIESYNRPPWTVWPSWAYVVLECATVAGFRDFASRMAYGILQRVYERQDRRDLSDFTHPLPGVSCEYWPDDPASFWGSEGYGWGATTASFVVRQLFGFLESPRAGGCRFLLAPALPADLLAPGRWLGIQGLLYRGRKLTISYRATGRQRDTAVGSGRPALRRGTDQARPRAAREDLEVVVSLEEAGRCRVRRGRVTVYDGVGVDHRFLLTNLEACQVEIE